MLDTLKLYLLLQKLKLKRFSHRFFQRKNHQLPRTNYEPLLNDNRTAIKSIETILIILTFSILALIIIMSVIRTLL